MLLWPKNDDDEEANFFLSPTFSSLLLPSYDCVFSSPASPLTRTKCWRKQNNNTVSCRDILPLLRTMFFYYFCLPLHYRRHHQLLSFPFLPPSLSPLFFFFFVFPGFEKHGCIVRAARLLFVRNSVEWGLVRANIFYWMFNGFILVFIFFLTT